RRGDGANDLVLHVRDLRHVAVIVAGPQVIAARRLDQLRADADAPAEAAYAALGHEAHAQLAADALEVDGPAPIAERRIAGDHQQGRKPRQLRDDVLAHAVAEMLLRGIAAEIEKRQYRDRRLGSQLDCGVRREGSRPALPDSLV